MFVVAGVTGNTGNVVAETLLSQGKKVRALVRTLEGAEKVQAMGCEPFIAALEDAEKLTAALKGAEGAYLLVPPYFGPGILRHNRVVSESIAQALRAARPPRAVLLSSTAAQRDSGTGPIMSVHQLEQDTRGISGVVHLRAGYFQENWFAGLEPAAKDGVLPSFLPAGVALAMVATRDIGETAAELLVSPATPPSVVQLAGPVDLTSEDVAEIFASALGRAVNVLHLPVSQVISTFAQFGLPEEAGALYQEMYQAAHDGRLDFERGIEVRRGKVSLAEVIRSAQKQRAA